MKKVVSLINCLLLASVIYCQTLDTVPPQSVQLRLKDWTWYLSKGFSNDSTISKFQFAVMKKITDTINVYGRQTAAEKEFTMPQTPASVIVFIYSKFANEGYFKVFAMGTTAAERNLIAMRIKAISNNTIQSRLTAIDNNKTNEYLDDLRRVWKKTSSF